MVKKYFAFLFAVLSLCLFTSHLHGDEEEGYVQEYYSDLLELCDKENWKGVIKKAQFIVDVFPYTPFAQEAIYYEALSQFQLKEYELANQKFSEYLKKVATMQHFEEAIQYKFQIAEKFRTGTRAHVFGWKRLPRWTSSIVQAYEIYDEVISSLPNHDIAARSLHGKGLLLIKDRDYRAAVEVFHTLIRRFPKHELTPQAYVEINRAYFTQCKNEFPDPDGLDLAEINLRKFREDFPGEEKFEVAEGFVAQMHEIFAQSLFETGEFFERTKKYQAALIYYTQVLRKYPLTEVANSATQRLHGVEAKIAKIEAKKKKNEPPPADVKAVH